MPLPYDLIVRFAAFTGLRAGELAALRIRDIDLLHGEVQVRRNKTHTSTGHVTSTPKTARSMRDGQRALFSSHIANASQPAVQTVQLRALS